MKLKVMKVDQTLLAFSTPIRQFSYANVEDLNRELASRILAMREASPGLRQSNYGGWHSDRNFLQNLGPELANRLVKVRVHRALGLSVLAGDEGADGLIFDIANYLAAHAAELGLTESE